MFLSENTKTLTNDGTFISGRYGKTTIVPDKNKKKKRAKKKTKQAKLKEETKC